MISAYLVGFQLERCGFRRSVSTVRRRGVLLHSMGFQLQTVFGIVRPLHDLRLYGLTLARSSDSR